MRIRNKLLNKEHQQKWWNSHKEVQTKRVRENARKFKIWADSLKNQPCKDCGIFYPPYVLDWDHIKGEKDTNLARLMTSCSKKRVLEEVEKCELVCSNCHRERTHQRLEAGSSPDACTKYDRFMSL